MTPEEKVIVILTLIVFFVSIVVCVFLEKMKSEDSDEEKYPLIDMGEENISDK